MTKGQTSVHLEESTLDMTDAIVVESVKNPDVPSFNSRSEVLRVILRTGFDVLEEREVIETESGEISGADLKELIPDKLLLEHRRDELKAEAKPLFQGSKVAERFREKTEELFEGEPDEKATPETVREIGDSYLEELETLEELNVLGERSIHRQRRAIEETVERYQREYNSAEHAPTETMRPTPDEARIGSEVKRLRERREEFVERLRDMAETDRFTNPEDLMKALAYDHGVSLEAVELVIDAITPDGTEGRLALKDGSGVTVPQIVVDDELEEPESEVDQLPEDAVIRQTSPDARSDLESQTD